jgi:hypothetical protein
MAAVVWYGSSASEPRVTYRTSRALAVLCVVATLPGWPALAQEASTHPNYLTQSRQAEDVPIDSVTARLSKSSGSTAQDTAALETVRALANDLPGNRFSMIEVSRLVTRMERETSVARVSYRLLPAGANSLRIEFLVDAAPKPRAEDLPTGLFAGNPSDFPILYKDDRSLYTAIVAGGFGVYSDGNPWFGQPELFNAFNPLAGHLPGRRATWTEGSLELGGGFATQLGDLPVYAFGALTGMMTWSLGQDIFRDDSRDFEAIEKAYAGLLYADAGTRNRAKISVGRQTYTLNDGFLVNMVKGSANVGPRGATYLGPRLANDFSVLADGRHGPWSFGAFYIDPDELESLESDSTFLGANLRYAFNDNVALDGTVITIPNSKSTYANPYGLTLKREGLNTVAGHLKWRNLLIDGLFMEGELAHQFHPDYEMSAWAGYGTMGFIARETAWTPSLSYRYAVFSGDDPDTETYERFDPLLSTGLGIWLQGISFGKLFSNSNLVTHRIQLNVVPVETLNVTFDYHKLVAPELNNLGSNPALSELTSHDIGQELTLSARWAISRNLYLQGVASYAIPGEALRDIGANDNWSTLQLSLYWSL